MKFGLLFTDRCNDWNWILINGSRFSYIWDNKTLGYPFNWTPMPMRRTSMCTDRHTQTHTYHFVLACVGMRIVLFIMYCMQVYCACAGYNRKQTYEYLYLCENVRKYEHRSIGRDTLQVLVYWFRWFFCCCSIFILFQIVWHNDLAFGFGGIGMPLDFMFFPKWHFVRWEQPNAMVFSFMRGKMDNRNTIIEWQFRQAICSVIILHGVPVTSPIISSKWMWFVFVSIRDYLKKRKIDRIS